MGSVEDSPNRYCERRFAITALVAAHRPVGAGVGAYPFTLAIWTDRLSPPPDFLKILNGLLVGLEGLEELDNVLRSASICRQSVACRVETRSPVK